MLSKAGWLMGSMLLLPVLAYYLGTPPNAFQWALIKDTYLIVGVVICYTFITGQLTGNNSQVDKLWSIVPVGYAWFFTAKAGWTDRMVLMSVLATLWGIRLTYNFARRGAYQWKFWAGEEDYRWAILRAKPGFSKPWVWLLFNLFFICFYQNTLIFLFILPILGDLHVDATALDMVDYGLALIFIGLLVVETIGDQQQWNFQREKYRRIRSGEDLGQYKKGFVSTGLWSKVRHPNYAAEQGIWIVYYLFSVSATGEWLNWTIIGAVLLVLLFKGSADFSEQVSASKYPEYKEYQKNVPRFLPFRF